MSILSIMVLEGPAGGGKSTWIKRVVEPNALANTVDLGLPRPRSYDGTEGLTLALMKDFGQLASVLIQGPGLYVLDRGIVSEWVYGPLRDLQRPQLTSTLHARNILREWTCLILHTRRLLVLMGVLPPDVDIKISLNFLIPNIETLVMQRTANTGREYPFDVVEEWHSYQRAYKMFHDAVHGQTELTRPEEFISWNVKLLAPS